MQETDLLPSTTAQGALFDYAALDAETRIVVQQRTGEIQSLVKRVAQDTVDIGRKLAECKDRLGGNGKFIAWLSAEFGWSERTAYNFIGVFTKFGQSDIDIANIANSALYLLAAPSTPPAAIETVKQIANSGEKVTHAVAKAVVEDAKVAEKRAEGALFEEPEASADEGDEDLTEPEEDEDAPVPAKIAATAKPSPSPKLDPAAKEIEQAWRKAEVSISLRFMPADKNGRKVLVTIQAEGLDPVTKLRQDADIAFIGPVLEMIESYKREMPAKIAAKKSSKASTTTPAKPAAKAAKKGAKK